MATALIGAVGAGLVGGKKKRVWTSKLRRRFNRYQLAEENQGRTPKSRDKWYDTNA